jgi:16S rRNA (cytosine967-C5)-methyltransferase
VFGTLSRAGATRPSPPTLPEGVAERWAAQWGDALPQEAAIAFAIRPPVDVSLGDAAQTARWAEALGGSSLAPGHVRLGEHDSITELPGFDDGEWWVQDLAASIPARLLGPGDDRTVLDLCAAPGGKTMQLAAAGWQVVSVDSSAKRLKRMGDNLARTGLDATTVVGDLRSWKPDAPADAVLLDAPCSATGIYRRHPDVLHRIGPRQIAELAELQRDLLARAAHWVKPGGVLVYATCSMEKAEGEDQAAHFLATRPDFHLAPPTADELPQGIEATAQGWVRTLPSTLAGQGGTDGFFIARFVRT